MTRYEAVADIARSAEETWTYAADILRHPQWMNVTDARVVRGDGREPGSRGRELLTVGPLRWDVEFEVVAAEPGRRIVWRSVSDRRLDAEVGLVLTPSGATSSHATYHGAFALRGPWRLLTPLVALEGASGVRRELARLKANVEAMPAAIAEATSA